MGIEVQVFKKTGAEIPNEKREEFGQRILKIFHAGGLMERKNIHLCGRTIITISDVQMGEDGFGSDYCYWDDSLWETACWIPAKSWLSSGKVGGRFADAVITIHTLEEQYIEGPAAVLYDGDIVTTPAYLAWVNEILDETYLPRNRHPWTLFEMMQQDQYYADYSLRENWHDLIIDDDVRGIMELWAIQAVIFGTSWLGLKLAGNDAENKDIFSSVRDSIQNYKMKMKGQEGQGLSQLVGSLREYYREPDIHCTEAGKLSSCAISVVNEVFGEAWTLPFPVFTVKLVAEIYEKDFWELWKSVGTKGWLRKDSNDGIDLRTFRLSTAGLFQLSGDEQILVWREDSDIVFSDVLKEWFSELRTEYDHIIQQEVLQKALLRWVMELLEYANRAYRRIYVHQIFFEETLENLKDIRYQAVWMIFDRMIYDPKMLEEGKKAFPPEDPNRVASVSGSFEMMGDERKNNKARVTIKRYLALLANKNLRMRVFGF